MCAMHAEGFTIKTTGGFNEFFLPYFDIGSTKTQTFNLDFKKQIKKVIFNDKKKATTILWKNGEVTVAKTSKNDECNRMMGFLVAYYKGMEDKSNSQFSKLWDEFNNNDVVSFE